MRSIKIFLLTVVFTGIISSCKDQLDVRNPNEPTVATLNTESGIIKYALSGIYVNGFVDLKYQDGVVGQFWGNGFFDLMADNVGAEAANVFMNQIGAPNTVKLDDGTVVPNPNSPQRNAAMLRQNNLNANGGSNCLYYEWGYMYSLNHSCNTILNKVDVVAFSGDAETKIAVLKAWAYWWKGFAYSRLGSIYYAGLIVDNADGADGTNNVYVTRAEILAEAESNFAKAEAILNTLTANGTYTELVGAIIPDFCQVGKGGILDPAMWIRNINTYRARNILANTRVDAMTNTLWDQILTLTNAGITKSDFVFTLRSNDNADILSPQGGALSASSTGDPNSAATYKISERLVSAFQPGDKRKTNNFKQLAAPWIGNADRGNVFNTRWQLLDGGAGLSGVYVYSDRSAGGYELFMAGSYDENQLMKAEANIYKGGAGVDAGLALIDGIRADQGAGLAATAGTGLTKDLAITELRRERRVGLLFRSVAFYDVRRYGIIDPIGSGGGLTGQLVLDAIGAVNTNATIDYDYLDYWDVPDTELALNKPGAGSADVVNPKP